MENVVLQEIKYGKPYEIESKIGFTSRPLVRK